MTLSPIALYFLAFVAALILSLVLTPAARSAAIVLDVFDHPVSSVKTHKKPVPYLGGVAIFLAFAFAILWIRILTSFPTGTLRSLRGLLLGAGNMFLLGLIDDIKKFGLHYRAKFFWQIAAALMVVLFGIEIKFIHPTWVGILLTVFWIVGITNAFNLIDIMDGLSSSIAAVAALSFLLIALPTEEIYVNFAAVSLCGAVLGFIPYNLSKSWRLFMGDSGSLFLGFVCGSLALGTSYGTKTDWGVFAPILILALPIYDTCLVFYLRIRRGMSPFLGSKDHFPLRLEMLGWSRPKILLFVICTSIGLSFAAFCATRTSSIQILGIIYGAVLVFFAGLTMYVLRARVQ